MYYNGSNRYRVHSFVDEVHSVMVLKYEKVYEEDRQKALELQNFFREIKNAAQNSENQPIENETIRLILESIKLPNGELLKNLFKGTGRAGGFRFERELTAIIEAVFSNLTEDEIDIGQINIGATTVDANIKGLEDKLTQKILKAIGTKSQKNIENSNGNISKKYYLSSVDGKIDVKGYIINIKANPNPELMKIYNLLKDATFSAKNYNSMTWDEKSKAYVEAQGHKALTLGKTNLYRSIVGTLESFGYEQRTAESALWAGLNQIKKDDTKVANHFYHLRYIYELTGEGLTYGGESYGAVKYLIYNDPSGEIYVKATSDILIEILETEISTSQALSTITIPKSKFIKA